MALPFGLKNNGLDMGGLPLFENIWVSEHRMTPLWNPKYDPTPIHESP